MNKITSGFVVQEYDDSGTCVAQEFIAGDDVQWEDDDENPIEAPEHLYQPFYMTQPPAKASRECSNCLRVLPETEFTGLGGLCVECAAVIQ